MLDCREVKVMQAVSSSPKCEYIMQLIEVIDLPECEEICLVLEFIEGVGIPGKIMINE